MSDEEMLVEATVGPYRGQRLTMPQAAAKQAIADKWAVDPLAPREEAKPQTDAEREEILAKAEAVVAQLRGEKPAKSDEKPPPKADPPPKAEVAATRDMAPEPPSKPYRTRSS